MAKAAASLVIPRCVYDGNKYPIAQMIMNLTLSLSLRYVKFHRLDQTKIESNCAAISTYAEYITHTLLLGFLWDPIVIINFVIHMPYLLGE